MRMPAVVAAFGLVGPYAFDKALLAGIMSFLVRYPAPETAARIMSLAASKAEKSTPRGENLTGEVVAAGEYISTVGTYEAAALVNDEGHPLVYMYGSRSL